MKLDGSKLWNRSFLIDSFTNLLIYLVYYLLIVSVTTYAADNLMATPSEAGLASGIFIIGTLITRILTGRSIELIGKKKLLYIGLGFYLVTTILYFGVNNLVLLFIIRFINGAAFGIAGTATGTIAAGLIPSGRRGEGISYYAMSATLASAIGPFTGILLLQQGSFKTILTLAVCLLVVTFLAVFFLKTPEVVLAKEQIDDMKGYSLDKFFEVKAVPVSIVSIFIGISFSSILSFLASYTREEALTGAGSFFFIVYAASILVSRPVTGKWFDKKGENFVMFPSFIFFAAGLLILGTAHNGPMLLIAGIFSGLGYGTFLSGAQAIAVKVSPGHKIGLATSTFFSFIDGGVGIGPFLLGFFIPVSGYRGMYSVMAFVTLGCSLLYYLLHGRKARQCEVKEIA